MYHRSSCGLAVSGFVAYVRKGAPDSQDLRFGGDSKSSWRSELLFELLLG